MNKAHLLEKLRGPLILIVLNPKGQQILIRAGSQLHLQIGY